jgi:hypothetical protein
LATSTESSPPNLGSEVAHVSSPVGSAAAQTPRHQKKIILIAGVAAAVYRAPKAAPKVAPVPTANPTLLLKSTVPLSDAINPSSSPSATRRRALSPSESVDSHATFNVGGSVAFFDDFRHSEQPPTTTPISPAAAAVRAVSNPSTLLGASAAKKIRAVSSRKDDNNVPLSHTKLSQLATEANKVLPKHMQLKNLKQQTVQTIDAFLGDLHNLRATASLTSLIASAQHRMTPAIHRQCCMRMLMLITTRSDLLELYKQSRAGSSQPQIDAGNNPSVNGGQGMGLNHQFHIAMNAAFNDASIVNDFPYDYFPSLTLPFHSNAVDKVATPDKFLYGLFVGMGLKQPLCPAGFPPGFFDVTKLDSIFLAGISEYHAHRVRFHQSGNQNKPPWFFVAPVLTLCPEKQEEFIDVDAKRWDSLAFQCVFEQIQEMQNLIGKAIPGGVGGGPSDATEVGSSIRAVLSKAKLLQADRDSESDAREKELHVLKVHALKDKAKARGSNSTALMLLIRDQLNLKKDFETLGDGDMAQVASDNVTRLKEELARVVASSSSESLSLSLTPIATGTGTPIRGASAQPQQLTTFY